jgi:FkbM family methyltransferase
VTITDQLTSATPPYANHKFGAPLVIYGAGGAGRSVARNLASLGVKTDAFIDAAAGKEDVRDGVPVLTLSEWLTKFDPAGRDALISLHNPDHNVAPIIDDLRNAGFDRILTMVDYVNAVEDPEFRYWLAPSIFYRDKAKRIDLAAALFSDSKSRDWFDASLRLRLLADYHGLPEPSRPDIYASEDLPRWPDPMRLMDCGAFVGDSIDNFSRAGYRFESLIAFEPDPDNYSLLAQNWASLNATFIPCAVSERARKVSFSAGQGSSSRIVEAGGGDIVQCVGIDQAFPNFAPTLLKLEVEGEELAVLQGAVKTLRRHRPGLAIAAYHIAEHLWELPLFIKSLNLGYKMYLRGHRHNNYSLILYCVAE